MAGVGGVGGSSSAQELKNDLDKSDTKADQVKQDRINAEQQIDQGQLAAASGAMSAFIQQIQVQSKQEASGNNTAINEMSPESAAKAAAVGKAVYNQIVAMMPSASSQMNAGESSGSGGGGGTESNSAMGGAASGMGAEDAADQKINQAAKAAVYGDIYNLLNKMQGVRETKQSLSEKITSIDQAMAGKKPGDTVKIPVWEYNQESGKVEFKGYKEMTYEQATVVKQKLNDSKDALSEMSQDDMFWMQRFMEQKSQLEQMISNVMKAASEAQSGIAGNLKAS